MEYNEEQKAAFKQQAAGRRRNQIVLAIPLAIGLIASELVRDEQAETILWIPEIIAGPIQLLTVDCALIYSYTNWRCPGSNKYIGRSLFRKTCHACGIAIR